MFPRRYFDGYFGYKYDKNVAWILDQTLDSYWTRNSNLKDFRVKQYIESNENDNNIINKRINMSDMDIISEFKLFCIDYVNVPSMSHLLSFSKYYLSNNLLSHIVLNISDALIIRQQIALNRKSKNILTENANQRSLSEKNNISSSELTDISSIIEIGIKSNFAMLNSIKPNKKNKILIKILTVLTNLLCHLGPLSLVNNPFIKLHQLLINLSVNSSQYNINKSYPLQSLLILTLNQATLNTTINTINTLFDTVLQSQEQKEQELTMKCPQPLYDLINNSYAITLQTPNPKLISDSFEVSLPIPNVFKTANIAIIDAKEEKKDIDITAEVDDAKDEEKIDPNAEKKLLAAKKAAIKQSLTDFKAPPIGGAITSYKAYLIYLNAAGLHKIGTGYAQTIKGKIYKSMKQIYLSDTNIAWMTTWIHHTNQYNHEWILIRFRFDIDSNDDTNGGLSGKIYVIDADKFTILGEMHQNGKGSIPSADNTAYDSLGAITTCNGPIFVNPESQTLNAFIFNESADDVITFKIQQFALPKLTYVEKGDIEIYGASKKKESKLGSKGRADASAFGWGQNGSGGLGLTDTASKTTPTALHLLPKIRFEKCFAGNETSFFVTSSGAVYANGRNGSGQLGLGKGNVSNAMKPALMKPLVGHKIIKISGSRHGSHTVFLSDKGKVFCAGNNGNGQVKFPNENSVAEPYCINNDEELLKISKKKGKKWLFFIDVAAATNRTAAVTKNGELYGWGNNNRRSMGLDNEQSFRHPTLEKKLAEKLKVKLVRIDMGHSFSIALDSKGDCYSVGDGSNGQLGLDSTQSKTEWTKIPFEHKWKDISAGYYHAMGLAKHKKENRTQIYVWGNNNNGQLGVGHRKRVIKPTAISSFKKDERIEFIQGGGFFSGCLTKTGDVYIWGSNSYGEQGQGDTTTRDVPAKVTVDGFDEEKIRCLAVGYYHVLAIPENRDPAIARNTLHSLRWYNAPHKIGCLSREAGAHRIQIYDIDTSDNRIFASGESVYTADDEEPIDITYNAYNHNVYAMYAGDYGADNLVLKRWINGAHLEQFLDRAAWESEYFLTHSDYLLDGDGIKQGTSSLISITVNFIACVDLMIKSKLIDPYWNNEDMIAEYKYFYGSGDKRALTLYARCLCVGDKNVFESLIKSVVTQWNILCKIWILRDSASYSLEDKIFRARIYLLIALFRILSFNVKMFSVKASGMNIVEDVNGPNEKMKFLGDELFQLLREVTYTVDSNMDKKKENMVEVQALNAIKYYAQEIFEYAFNVFYATWDGRAHFLLTLMDDITRKKDAMSDISFKKIGVANILKLSAISTLYAIGKKEEKKYFYKKDAEKDKKEEDDEDEDEEKEVITSRHKIIEKTLQFLIATDLQKLNGKLSEDDDDVGDIRRLMFEIISCIQMDISNKIAFKTIKSSAVQSNPSKIFILSLQIITESDNLLTQIMKSDIKNKQEVIQNSNLLQCLLPSAVHSFKPYIERLRVSKHAEVFAALNRLNDVLNTVNKASEQKEEHKEDLDADLEDVMVIESQHPYKPTECKRYECAFDDSVHAVMIDFDIRCRFRCEDDQLVIGFAENANYFHGNMLYGVPGTIIVPSNKINISFASYGTKAQRKEAPPPDALQKRWGWRIYIKPHVIRQRGNFLYNLQLELCDILAHIACLMISDREDIKSKLSIRYPKPAALFGSDMFRNGLEAQEDDIEDESDVKTDTNTKSEADIQSFLHKLLADNEEEELVLMDEKSNIDRGDDAIISKIRGMFSNAQASNCVMIPSECAYGGIQSEINIKIFNELNEPFNRLLNQHSCNISAALYKKIQRKPREEERDWHQQISWSQYERKSMDFKVTQFGLCFDGDNTVYIIGGYREGNVDSEYCYKYDMKEDKYTKIKSIDFAVKCHCIGMLRDGRILSIGGYTSHFAIYSPSDDTWDYTLNTDENKKNFGSGSRFVTSINKNNEEIIHCIGGAKFDDDDDKKNEEHGGDKYYQYNMHTNEWKAMPNVPTKVKCHGLVMDKFDRIYCFGGKANGKQMYCFDGSGKWLRCPDIPIDCCSFGYIMDNNNRYILILGGSDSVQPHNGSMWNHMYVYDTFDGEWTKSAHNIPFGVKDTQCCMKGKVCHLFGGSNGSPMNKHVIGTANIELVDKELDKYKCFKLKDGTAASADILALVEEKTTFEVEYAAGISMGGLAKVKWTPYVGGEYLIDIFVDGEAIQQSPFVIQAQPLINFVMDIDETEIQKERGKLYDIVAKLVDGNENVFVMPEEAVFVYDAEKYDVAFVEYATSLSYAWQKYVSVEDMIACDMPEDYRPSLSTGIYGVYDVEKVEKTEMKIDVITNVEEEEKYDDGLVYLEAVAMGNEYKPSYSTGVYGVYSLNEVPFVYKPSYYTGVYGSYVINNKYEKSMDEIKRDIECESDGSSTEEEEEDTFNALFKDMEKHSTHKKEENMQENDDVAVVFGATKKSAMFPKKLMIDGKRAVIKYEPIVIAVDDKKEEKEESAEDKDKINRVSITTDAAYKAMKCVFLAFIKHLGFDAFLYKWSRNQYIDQKMIDFIGSIWKYSALTVCGILREREDFPLKKVAIKTKNEMQNKDKDIKEILKAFKEKRKEDRDGNNEEEKKDEEKKKEDENKKIYTGVCKEFDIDNGFGIIAVDEDDFDDIKVDKMEIFAQDIDNNQTLLIGEKLQFEVIEKDGAKIAICCTGINGEFVVGIKEEKEEKKEAEAEDDTFDGFERGYIHLYKQCKVLMNIRNNKKTMNIENICNISDFNDVLICKSIKSILNLDESIEFDDVLILVRDRRKIAVQKQAAYETFIKLFVANDVSLEFYLLILWYFYRSFSGFSYPSAAVYRQKPEIFNAKLSESLKQHKYRLCNEFFNAHFLGELDGVNLNITNKLKITFWNIMNDVIQKIHEYKNNLNLKQIMTNICTMDWRKEDLKHFKKTYKTTLVDYLYQFSPTKINKKVISDEKEEDNTDKIAHFWNEDIFKKYIFDSEIKKRKELLPNENGNNIIRQELASLTWIGDIDINEKLFIKKADEISLKLNVNTLKIINDADQNQFVYKLYGKGSSPLISNGVKFEGEYRPFAEDTKTNIDLLISCASSEIKIDVASWSNNDAVKDGFNKSHIRIDDGDNEQTANYGIHFALLNLFNGGVVKYKYFDIHSSANNVQPFIDYVKDLPLYHLIIITSYYNSGKHWKESIYDALKVYGWEWKKVEEYESFVFVANTDGNQVYFHKKRMKTYGPIKKELFIPLIPTPDIKFNGFFVDSDTINGDWDFVMNAMNVLWDTYIKSVFKADEGLYKEHGSIDFNVCKELEDGWKWKEEENKKEDMCGTFCSYLRIPPSGFTLTVSSNKNTQKNMIDNNLETYWQSGSSNKKHWISFDFNKNENEYASFSGIGIYFDFRKDANYTPEKLKVHIAETKDDKDNDNINCIVTRCVQREFKGVYTLNINEISNETKGNEMELENENKIGLNGVIKCKYIKIEWINEVQSKYARIRQIFLYSKKINQFDKKIKSCFVQNHQLLTQNIWKSTDLLDELQKEYDDDWIENNVNNKNKNKNNNNNDDSKEKEKDKTIKPNKVNQQLLIDDLFGDIEDDTDDSYSDDEEEEDW